MPAHRHICERLGVARNTLHRAFAVAPAAGDPARPRQLESPPGRITRHGAGRAGGAVAAGATDSGHQRCQPDPEWRLRARHSRHRPLSHAALAHALRHPDRAAKRTAALLLQRWLRAVKTRDR
nr:hypothetical protein [Kushneria konosiri]